MANITDLGTTLDEMATKTNAVPANLLLYMTEYGFETNPPDPFSGVPLPAQAKFNTIGEFLAWSNPRIAAQAQFLLADVHPVRGRNKSSKSYWFTYQSGLFYQRGQPKPAAYAYAFPFTATPTIVDPATGLPAVPLVGAVALPGQRRARRRPDPVPSEGRLIGLAHGRRSGGDRHVRLLRGRPRSPVPLTRRVARRLAATGRQRRVDEHGRGRQLT
jgi:hypothetical protein